MLNKLESFKRWTPSDGEYELTIQNWYFYQGGIMLFGSAEVNEAMTPVTDLLFEIGDAMTKLDPSRPRAVRWAEAFRPREVELAAAEASLIAAMNRDVTRGILPD